MSEPKNEPKIVIDSDWKNQAQAEKERLAALDREKTTKTGGKIGAAAGTTAGPTPGSAGAGALGDDADEALPEPSFKTLLGTLITNALMYMGAFPDPQTGRAMVAPEYAKFHIDLISILQEKTKGNLSADESKDVEQAIKELQMQFVELMRAVTAMAMKQDAQRRGAGAGGIGGMGGMGSAMGGDPAEFSQKLRGH